MKLILLLLLATSPLLPGQEHTNSSTVELASDIPKDAPNEARDPLQTDDRTEGYSTASLWTNTITGAQFYCEDATPLFARWKMLTAPRPLPAPAVVASAPAQPNGDWKTIAATGFAILAVGLAIRLATK